MKVPERRLPFVHLALIGILVGAATLLPLFAQGPAPTGQYDAQAPASAARNKSQERERAKPPSHAVTNGIHVADAKLFDERTLQQMLQAAEANLASLRFLDQSTAGAAVGRMQGGRLDQWSIGMSATLPTSATSATNTTDHKSEAGADGTKTTDTVSTSQTTTSPAQTPTVPAPPALPSTFAAGNQIGVAAQDVLAEQVMLTYQVMNLRLLLDRAISDRVFARDATLGGEVVPFVGQRRQVVVGFQVNVEPDRRYKNAIAEVDVRVVDCREASQAMRELTSRSSPSTAEARQKMLADKGLAPCGDYVVAPAAAAPSSPPRLQTRTAPPGARPGPTPPRARTRPRARWSKLTQRTGRLHSAAGCRW